LRFHTRSIAALLAVGLAARVPAGSASGGNAPYRLPGGAVFPEGVAVDKANGDLFVGSTADGTVYRGDVEEPGELEVFLEPGADGRESVTGMKVDTQGRLLVAGRRTGRVFAYDTATGELVAALEVPGSGDSLVNDLTVTPDAAFVTDSFRPVVYRLPLDEAGVGEVELWLDLEGTPLQYEDGFNLNGISASDDGRYLLTVQSNTGALWRIDTDTREVTEVDLDGETLEGGDGLLLDGRQPLVVRNDPPVVAHVELAEDLASGEVVEEITDETFDYPTTVAEQGGRLLVVNSQLDREGGDADEPFTVSAVPFPGSNGPACPVTRAQLPDDTDRTCGTGTAALTGDALAC